MQDLSQNGVLDFETGLTIIPHFFYLNYQGNSGAAFSMFSGKTIALIVFTLIMLIGMIILDYFISKRSKNTWFYTGMILFYAGGVGNLIDRLFLGYVRDFIYFTFFPTVFNLADVCLVVGVICIMVYILFYYNKEKGIELPKKEEDQARIDEIKARKVEDGRVVEKSQYDKEEHVETIDGEDNQGK